MREGDRLEECGVPADVGENERPARRSRGAGVVVASRVTFERYYESTIAKEASEHELGAGGARALVPGDDADLRRPRAPR